MQNNIKKSRKEIEDDLNTTFDTLTTLLNNIEITLKDACNISKELRETDMSTNWDRLYDKLVRDVNYDEVVKTVTILSNWSRMYGLCRYKMYVSLWKNTIQVASSNRIRLTTLKRKRSISNRCEMYKATLSNIRWMRMVKSYSMMHSQNYVKHIKALETELFSQL